LVIDRLHAGYVGAYGNAWIDTPALDRLACEAFTFDQALVDGPTPESFLRSVWQGRHPLARPEPIELPSTLAALLSRSGVRTTLLTDQAAVARNPLARSFDERVEIDPSDRPAPARSVEDTHLARCFAQTIGWLGDRLDSSDGPFLLWCHLSGMAGPWDAPYEFRDRYAEPGDPAPPRGVDVPRLVLEEDFDPDLLLGITQSYAGQVSLLDTCVAALVEFLGESPAAEETLLVLLSSRGFPLGEHRRVGACDDALHGELVHVPMMIRFPGDQGDTLGAAARSQALVTPADLRATLLDWWDVALPDAPDAGSFGESLMPIVRGEVESVRDRLCIAGGDTVRAIRTIAGGDTVRAIRTPAWYLRMDEEPELYAKPDDRWEVNDVANRCRDVVEELQDAAAEYEACLLADRLDELSPLSEVLMSGM
jgi:arylsulfatase A-like enzyme